MGDEKAKESRSSCLGWLTWGRAIVVSVVAAVVVGITVFLFVPVRFTATTSVLVRVRPDVLSSLADQATAMAEGAGRLPSLSMLGQKNQQLERLEVILDSRRVRQALIDKYHLVNRLGVAPAKVDEELKKMTVVKELQDVGEKVAVTCRSRSRLMSWIGARGGLTAGEAKELAADLANAYISNLDLYSKNTDVEQATDNKRFIASRKEAVEAQLSRTQDKVQALETRYAMVDPHREADLLIDETKTIVKDYAEAAAQTEAMAHSLQVARKDLSTEDATRIESVVTARNPVIEPIEEKVAGLQADLQTEISSGETDEHPEVAATRAAIASLQKQLTNVAADVRQQIGRSANPAYDTLMGKVIEAQVNLAAQQSLKAAYGHQLDQARTKMATLPPVVREYVNLVRQQNLEAALLTILSQRLELATIEEHREKSWTFQVLDVASPPLHKSGPSAGEDAGATFIILMGCLSLLLAYRRGLFNLD